MNLLPSKDSKACLQTDSDTHLWYQVRISTQVLESLRRTRDTPPRPVYAESCDACPLLQRCQNASIIG